MYDGTETALQVVTVCCHCGRHRWIRCPARRLCEPCWRNPAIRHQHPLPANLVKFSLKGILLSAQATPEPTAAIPGTEAKIEVLAGRAERGENLWHVLDLTTKQLARLAVREDTR